MPYYWALYIFFIDVFPVPYESYYKNFWLKLSAGSELKCSISQPSDLLFPIYVAIDFKKKIYFCNFQSVKLVQQQH